ncbi:MAG TPA: zf-HC2 domain-containing protein, partial [bacterium]|nr:zf-HC2 domain-containing protein [bacterium]
MTTKTRKQKPTCPNWQILLGEYALGTIGERDRARLEGHFGRCRRCRRALAETEKMYRLLGDFELAKAGPFFTAKVERAVRGEAGEAEAARSRTGARTGFRGWLRTPAFISAAAAAAAAIVVATLYVKVWLPGASERAEAPAAPAAVPPAASIEKADRVAEAEEKEAAGVTGRRTELPALARKGTEETFTELRAPDEFTTYDAAAAAAPPSAEGRGAPATHPAGLEDEARTVEEPAADFDALMSRDAGAGAAAFGRAARGYARTDAKAAAFAAPGTAALTAADVEAWMDARFEADVERLTGDE